MNTSPHIAALAARSIFQACALLSLMAILALPVLAQEVESLPAPTPDSLLAIKESQNGFALTWIEVPHAAEYKLEVKKHSEGDESWVRVTKGDFGPLPGGLSSYSLTGVATGLDCGTAYDAQLSIKGDGTYYEETFGEPLLITTHSRLGNTGLPGAVATTECAKAAEITNLRRTVEPGVVTLTWTAPTDDKFTGFEVRRINRVDDEAQGAQPPAQDPLTTLHESNNDSRTRYEDRTVVEGYSYAYIVTPIERLEPPIQHTDGTTEEYRAPTSGRAFTGEAPLRPTSTPVYPRNVRFTQESRSSRRLQWETPSDRHLTIEKIYRGETSSPVNDPWLTGYQVERREYLLYKAARSDEFTTVFPDFIEETLLSTTVTVGNYGPGMQDRGYSATPEFSAGQLSTDNTFTHGSTTYTVKHLLWVAGTQFALTLDPLPPEDVYLNWRLLVGTKEYRLGDTAPQDAIGGVGGSTFWWAELEPHPAINDLVSIEIVGERTLDWEVLREGDSNLSTTFIDSENTDGRTYVYRVLAKNAFGLSSENDTSNWAWMDPPPIGGL